MSDWLKTLIGALAGFTTGLIAQPLNLVIADIIRRRHLARALHIELSANIGALAYYGLRRGGEGMYFSTVDEWGPILHREAFDYALRQPDVFLRLSDASTISNLYELMYSMRLGDEPGLDDVLGVVVKRVTAGDIDEALLCKLAPKHTLADIRLLLARNVTTYDYDDLPLGNADAAEQAREQEDGKS